MSQLVTHEIFWLSLGVRKPAFLVVVALRLVWLTQDLWLGAELKAVVLREVLYNSLFFVEVS